MYRPNGTGGLNLPFFCAGRAEESSSDFTEPDGEDSEKPTPKKSSHKSRAGRLANLFKNGIQGGKAETEDAGPAKDGADDDMAASDHFWHGLSKKVCRSLPVLGCLVCAVQHAFRL